MQELLFAKQPEWSHQQEPQKELMIKYAQELGLDLEKFTASLSNIMVIQKIERDRQDGFSLGVNGTPTFFINEKKLENLSYEDLKAQIDSSLQASN
jgi:protein-disulfide isomerase